MAYDSILNAAAIGTMLIAGGKGIAHRADGLEPGEHPVLFGDPAAELAATAAAARHLRAG